MNNAACEIGDCAGFLRLHFVDVFLFCSIFFFNVHVLNQCEVQRELHVN
jgi:hypothetical protein